MENKIQELEKEVSTLKENPQPKSYSLDLLDFYLKKYNEQVKEIENERLKTIEKEIKDLEVEQSNQQNIVLEYEAANNDFQSSLNHYNHWQDELQQKYEQVDNLSYEYNNKCNDLYKEINALNKTYNEKINYYVCLLDSLNDNEISINVFEQKIEDLIKYFNEIGSTQSIQLLDLIKEVRELTNTYNDKVYSINADIIDLQNAISQVCLDSPEDNLREAYEKAEDIQLAINRKTHAKETLESMFKELRDSQEKELSELYQYLNLIEETKSNIAEKLEDKISSLLNEFNKSETKEHKYNVLMDEYNNILKDLFNYEPIIVEIKSFQEDYNKKNQLYKGLTSNIEEMKKYIANTYTVINSNQQFFKFFEEYIYSKKRIKELKKEMEELDYKNKENNDNRKTFVMDPYAKLKLDELDAIIYETDDRIKKDHLEIEQLTKKINDSKLINEELFNIIENKEKIEEIVPEIENQISKVKEELDTLLEKINSNMEVVKDYKLKNNRKLELEKLLAEHEENNN